MKKPEERAALKPFDWDKELEKVEKIARMIGRKWPKGLSSVEAVRKERR